MPTKKKSVVRKSASNPSPLKPGEVPVLKVVHLDGLAFNNFKWPLKVGSVVKAPDWKKTKDCGNGLHGWLYGEGDSNAANILDSELQGKWLVLAVDESTIVQLEGKVKFPSCRILFVGTQLKATKFLSGLVRDKSIIGNTVKVGDHATATVGGVGTAKAGKKGTAIAGRGGYALAGAQGNAIAGDYGKAEAGFIGFAKAGMDGQASVGDKGRAIAGMSGTASAGVYGTAEASTGGQASVGRGGHAIAGRFGSVSGGNESRLTITCHKTGRPVTTIVGKNGIRPDVFYVLSEGKFIEKPLDFLASLW